MQKLQHDVYSKLLYQPSVQIDISTTAVFPKRETEHLPQLLAVLPPHGATEHQAEQPPTSQPFFVRFECIAETWG